MVVAGQRAGCPVAGCTYQDMLVGGARCPVHGRPLVALDVLAQHADDPMIGRTIAGDFDLVDIIGRGAMGAVYRGWQHSERRSVAIKVISGKAVQALDDPTRRFVMEARALAAMPPHPCIVKIYAYGEDEGLLYMVLELVDGPSLKAFSEQRRLPSWQVADLALGILGALGEAHEAGVVHRDLKPSNVVVVSDHPDETRCKVLDFGVAKVFWPDDALVQEVVTRAGMALGTPKYMSPEQARGQTVGPGSDLYSLGVMLYRLLAGRLPFDGDNDLKILKAHILDQPPAWPEGCVVPPEMDAFVRRLLAKRAVERFPDAPSAARALSDVRHALGGPSRITDYVSSPGRRPPESSEEMTDLDLHVPSHGSSQVAAEVVIADEPGAGSWARGALFIAVAVLLGVGAGVVGLMMAPDDEPTPVVTVADRPTDSPPTPTVDRAAELEKAYEEAVTAARTGEPEKTLSALQRAFGSTDDAAALRARIAADPAFGAVRADPGIKALLSSDAPSP